VQTIFNNVEAQKKVLFEDYWKTLTNFDQEPETLRNDFESWFEAQKIEETPTETETTV